MKEEKTCEVCGSNQRVNFSTKVGKYLCSRHYQQVSKYGYTKRTVRDKNEIIIHEGYAEIILCDKLNNEIARSKIDIDDIDKINKYRWCVHCSDGYVSTTIYKTHKKLFLHQLVLGEYDSELDIDHISGDTLDNRKSNLRLCNHYENMRNVRVRSDSSTGIKGVHRAYNGKFKSYIVIAGKITNLGTFINIEDAIRSRLEAEHKYFGEFARKEVN